MTRSAMQAELSLPTVPPIWEEWCAEAQAYIPTLLDEDRLSAILADGHLLLHYREEVLTAARKLRADSAAGLYLSLLALSLRREKMTDVPVQRIRQDTQAGRLSLLFPLLDHIPENIAYLRAHGVPEENIHGTFYEFERGVDSHLRRTGEIGLLKSSFDWLRLIYENRLVRVGRLNFELRPGFIGNVKAFRNATGEIRLLSNHGRIHASGRPLGAALFTDETNAYTALVEETEEAYLGHPIDAMGRILPETVTLPKAEWSLALQHGDPVIAVHIPTGESLTEENCEAAYAGARSLFDRCFPDFPYKGFSCISWMMDRQLQTLAKPGAGIVTFQKKYIPFQRKAPGTGVFAFVFQTHPDLDPATMDYRTLPENTSLHRSLKQHYISGKRVYEDGGIFF